MKILFISENYPPHIEGGAEISTSLLANWLVAKGHEVAVATCRFFSKDFRDEHGVVVYPRIYRASLGSRGLFSAVRYAFDILTIPWRSIRALRPLLRREAFDVINIVVTFYYYMPIVTWLARHAKAKIVVDCRDYSMICPAQFKGQELTDPLRGHHGYRCLKDMYQPSSVFLKLFSRLFARYESFVFNWYKSSLRTAVARSNRIVLAANSEYVREQCIHNGFPKQKVVTIYNISQEIPPVDLPKFAVPTFVYGGRIQKEKGIWDLVRAAQILRGRTNTPFVVKVAGSGDQLEALQSFVKEKDLSYIEVLGQVDHNELLRLYAQSLAIVAPSRWPEPFGRFIQESASVGTPVIATRSGGIPEGVKDGKTGYLFDIGDVHALAGYMQHFLEHPETSRRYGAAAQAELQTYRADQIGNNRLGIYTV